MKILFLCGSLEPGRDGVGDYTRRLAGECIRQGHAARMVALGDRRSEDGGRKSEVGSRRSEVGSRRALRRAQGRAEGGGLVSDWEMQDDYGTGVPCLRWSARETWRSRGRALVAVIERERPDVVSLQFVPYSFHPKGLCFGLVAMLRRVARQVEVRWHIMFHELWIGRLHSRLGFLIGPMQKRLCLTLTRILPRPVIHTHMTGFLTMLRRAGLAPAQLPLFGNIPVVPEARLDPAQASLVGDAAVILHFGTFTPRLSALRSKMEMLHAAYKDDGAGAHFVSIGSAGPHGKDAQAIAEAIFGAERTHFLGVLSPQQISAWMQRAAVGLSRSPQAIYEKSGSTAAMLEHGLDVRLLDNPSEPLGRDNLPDFPPDPLPSLARTTRCFLSAFR